MIASVGQFVQEILSRSSSSSRTSVYRGHGSDEWKLQPSIFRSVERKENEHILLRELIASHPEEFASDRSALEMLVRMQHFSLPTRLLDVSFNPMVALYFACETAHRERKILTKGRRRRVTADGEVLIMSMPKRHVKYFDSDTVSCLSNLARLRHNLKEKIDTSLTGTDFNKSLPVKRLIHFVRQESRGFEPEIIPHDLDSIILVKPKQNNRRILAQAGAFFIFGLVQELTDPNVAKVERIQIASEKKGLILSELDKLGINEKTLFPDIERAARYITGSVVVPVSGIIR